MSLTTRGRIMAAIVTVAVLAGGFVGVLLLTGGSAKIGPVTIGKSKSPTPPPPPPTCPLLGLTPKNGIVPSRPALAIKVENLPAARPQTGLDQADIVYEEPVEAGITRFIAVYQCQDSPRVEPVRSGRLTDPDILVQFGHPLFGFAGGVPQVKRKVIQAGLIDVNYLKAVQQYHRDPARPAPHNLFTSTKELYAFAHSSAGAPELIFTYSADRPKGAKKVHQVHLPFSSFSDVFWKWSKAQKAWLRFHGTEPHMLTDGVQVSAKNVVIQVVKVFNTNIHDVNGVPSPEVVATGSGKAYVLRNGRMIEGTWTRPTLGDVTKFVDASGKEIALDPGNTWVELLPQAIPVSFP